MFLMSCVHFCLRLQYLHCAVDGVHTFLRLQCHITLFELSSCLYQIALSQHFIEFWAHLIQLPLA